MERRCLPWSPVLLLTSNDLSTSKCRWPPLVLSHGLSSDHMSGSRWQGDTWVLCEGEEGGVYVCQQAVWHGETCHSCGITAGISVLSRGDRYPIFVHCFSSDIYICTYKHCGRDVPSYSKNSFTYCKNDYQCPEVAEILRVNCTSFNFKFKYRLWCQYWKELKHNSVTIDHYLMMTSDRVKVNNFRGCKF